MTYEEYKAKYRNRDHVLIRMTDVFPFFIEKVFVIKGDGDRERERERDRECIHMCIYACTYVYARVFASI